MSLFRQSAALVLTTKLTATEKEVHGTQYSAEQF